eukprot:PRCOL_00007069-RA
MTPSGDSAAAAAAAGGGGAGVPAGAREVCSATPTLARIKVVPNSADEEREANFPRNLHNAAELFLRAGLAECARACIGSANALFAVLKDGPDGKQSHSVGRAAICWQTNFVRVTGEGGATRTAAPLVRSACFTAASDAAESASAEVSTDSTSHLPSKASG